MSREEQDRRRALKRARRELDRRIQPIAAAGKGKRLLNGLPSTRSKQAKWHHELVNRVHARVDAYRSITSQMREIDAELARNGEDRDEPCMCHMSGDTFDPRGCPAHDEETRRWA